jgi:hypothetical protein
MRPTENTESSVKEMNFSAGAELRKHILDDAMKAHERTRTQSVFEKPNIWRIFMRNKIVRIAAAAVILVSVALGVTNILERGTSTAYAIEQTIEANHSIRFLHIKYFDPKHSETEPKEIWLEFDEGGQPKNIRAHMPEWESLGEGPSVVVWNQGKMQVWFKNKNLLETRENNEFSNRFLMMAREADPKLAVERFYELQQKKQVELEITKPANKAEPIIVKVTHLPNSPYAGWRWVLYVDQSTNLVNSVDIYRLQNGEFKYEGRLEYYDYNQPITPEMFTLDVSRESKEFIAKVNQVNINDATVGDIIRILGKPLSYRGIGRINGNKTLSQDNLPDYYAMEYPNSFWVYINKGKLDEFLLGEDCASLGYIFRDKIRIGSSLDEVLDAVGQPVETVVGQPNKWENGVLYKDIDGHKGECYYQRPDQGVRIFFTDYKVTTLGLTRTESPTKQQP